MLRETVQHLYCTHYEVRTPDMAPTGRHVEESQTADFRCSYRQDQTTCKPTQTLRLTGSNIGPTKPCDCLIVKKFLLFSQMSSTGGYFPTYTYTRILTRLSFVVRSAKKCRRCILGWMYSVCSRLNTETLLQLSQYCRGNGCESGL
jgi:hypothetical protein